MEINLMMQYAVFSIATLAIFILDLFGGIRLANKKWFIPYLFFMPHLPLLCYYFMHRPAKTDSMKEIVGSALFVGAVIVFQLYTTLRLHFQLLGKKNTANTRVNLIYAGSNLLQCGLWGLYLLVFWYILCFLLLPVNPYQGLLNDIGISGVMSLKGTSFLVFEVVYAIVFVWLFLANGCLRIFFGSRNLAVGKRVLILVFMWVPFVQLWLAYMMCRAAKDEYLVTVSRSEQEAFTVKDDACYTKYPLILVHGIGFRDLRYFNYWGRIPRILKQHGAVVYYGHQNAWGTIEDNAHAIAAVIDRVLEEQKCDKVNIIAHSKGGLDCRYLISSLGYGDRVASLTTINTPHRGSEIITILNKLPDGIYRFIADRLNKPFLLVGEKQPDCYSSSKQLDPAYCEKFNEDNPDAEGVMYQSYTSVMRNMFSDSLLSIPYLMMCTQKGRQNDGLVDVSSAKWGDFRGVLESEKNRGISHGDMIDLKRDDINGFDVIKKFHDIVCELKGKGY